MSETRPGRGADQFIVRFPEGMRDEIRRLAEENGRSMNAELIELLRFALANSGLDIDELLQTISLQQQENARLRSLFKKDRDMASSILWQVLGHVDEIPASLTLWADSMLRILDPETDLEEKTEAALERPDAAENREEAARRVANVKERYVKHMDESVARILKERGLDTAFLDKDE